MQSLRVKFTLFFLAFVMVPFTAGWLLVFRQLTHEALVVASDFMANNLNTVSRTVDEILKNVEFAYTPLLSDNDFVEAVKSMRPPSERRSFEDYDPVTISSTMTNIYVTNNYIDSIFLYSPVARTFFVARGYPSAVSDTKLDDSSWYETYLQADRNARWMIVDSDQEGHLLTSYREIREFGNPVVNGVVSINVNDRVIENLFRQMRFQTSGFAFATDGQRTLSSAERPAPALVSEILARVPDGASRGFFRDTLDGADTLTVYHVSDFSNLTYVAMAPMREINTSSSILVRYAIYFYVFMIVVFLASLGLAYVRFYAPIKRLVSAMRVFEKGDFSVRLKDHRSDEIGFINRHFNDMVSNIKELIDREYGHELAQKEAQLKALLSQINDHFLYNTLDSIHWLARKNEVPEICDVVFSLSRFYRLNLSDGNDAVQVADVKEMLESYLSIQKFRMTDDLHYSITVEPGVEDRVVLKYLFQPIVENAVIHGIAKSVDGGRIDVAFRTEGEMLVFTVTDTGAGMDARTLAALRDPEQSGTGFALHNIRDQIRLYYGSGSLELESQPGCGTWVRLTVPCATEAARV